MRASLGNLAKVCQQSYNNMKIILDANKIEYEDKTFYSEKDKKQVAYREYDSFQVIKLMQAYNLKYAKIEEEKHKVTQEEFDELPF